MTPEQEQRVTDYQEYALHLARSFDFEDDEYEGVALETLCNAAQEWNPGTGTFGGYLRIVITRRLIDFKRRWRREVGRVGRDREFQVVSIEKALSDGRFALHTQRFATEDFAGRVAISVDANTALDQCDLLVKRRIVHYSLGYTMQEIAEADDVTEAAISKCFTKVASKHS